MNPFELTGPAFLGVYLLVGGAALISATVARRVLRPAGADDPRAEDLHPYELAWLEGGADRTGEAVIAKLYAEDALVVTTLHTLVRSEQVIAAQHPLERKVLECAAGETSAQQLKKEVAGASGPIEVKLRQLGLATTAEEDSRARSVSVALMLLPVALGGYRLFQGLTHEKPVLFLGVLWLASVALAFVLASRPVRTTDAGAKVLAKLKASVAHEPVAGADPMRAALAVGLFGVGLLPASLSQAFNPPSTGGGGAGGGGCGDGDGDGGGCGGCGGCGD